MNYTPKQDLKRTYSLSLCFMIPGVIFFMMAAASSYTVVMQSVGLLFCSLGLFLMYRYALTSFHYIIEDGELTVHRITGKRINAVARVALSECEILVKKDSQTLKGKKYAGGKYTYTANPAPKSEYLLVFSDAETKTALILECGTEFAAAISALMPHNSEIKL